MIRIPNNSLNKLANCLEHMADPMDKWYSISNACFDPESRVQRLWANDVYVSHSVGNIGDNYSP